MTYVASNLGGRRHRHLMLTMTSTEYMSHTGFLFVPPHNPDDYPTTIGTAQQQVLVTEKFQQNQALFSKYTAMDGSIKKQIVAVV